MEKNTVSLSNIVSIRSGRFLIGALLAILSLLSCYVLVDKWKAGIVFAVMFLGLGAFKIKDGVLKDSAVRVLYVAYIVVAAFAGGFLTQHILNERFLSIGAFRVALTMCLFLVLFLAVYAVILRPVAAVNVVVVALVLFSFANHFVFAFRGSEIQPADILSIRTAGNVAAQYHIVITGAILYALIMTAAFVFAGHILPHWTPSSRGRARILSTLAALAFAAVLLPASITIKPLHFLQTGSVLNGFLLNFTTQFREAFVVKPTGYRAETAIQTAERYSGAGVISDQTEDKPDFIVIMDESFADLGILGSELKTNIEVTPFIDSLSEDVIKGYALSSVYGGGTPNSEFEFLSGHSMMFLPAGSIAYQQFLKQPSYSMVGEMKENGYRCIAAHPYYASGWERASVYPYLGFDETCFIDDFPTEDPVREFVGDQKMFEKVIDLYEEKKAAGQDVFLFGVTMQNHGAFDYVGDHYQQTVFLEGYNQDYDDAEQYLTLIHETDRAVECLIDYFRNIDHNVVVVFFGDHLPNLNNDFYEEIHGKSFETLDEQQLKYTIPFFIWANYDIEEETVELTSLNYLSNYMYRVAGFSLPEYNQALADIQNNIPAMNANGFYSTSEQAFLPYKEAEGQEEEILNYYNQLEYNCLFDKTDRNQILFPLPGEKGE